MDPISLIMNTDLGTIIYSRREYDQAIEQLQKTLDLAPDFADARLEMGRCYRQKGMLEEALGEFQKARLLIGDKPVVLGKLGHAYALSGDTAKAKEMLMHLKGLSEQGYLLNYDVAFVYCGLGDKDKAFEWLERAYQQKEGDTGLGYIKADPAWDDFHSDSRFKSLLRRMNL